MLSILRILVIVILLNGCSSLFDVPITVGNIANHSKITWKTYKTQKEVQDACNAAARRVGSTTKKNILGCAEWHRVNDQCTIHSQVPEFLNDRRTTTLGHETLHCFAGPFHK